MAPQEASSMPKLRLNVAALIGQNTVAKFMHCVNPNASIQDLSSRLHMVLQQNGIHGHIVRLTNTMGSNLPSNEVVCDVLRDGEEVIVVVTRHLIDEDHHERFHAGEANTMNILATDVTQLPDTAQAPAFPGPVETFEDDVEGPRGLGDFVAASAPDWGVETLTPKLREFISHRFQDAQQATADPGRTGLTITMRPNGVSGSIVTPLPVTYQLARVDIIEFERLCAKKVQEVRTTLDYFQRCQEALQSLVNAGTATDQQAPNMLPYHYRAPDEVKDLLTEVGDASFGQVDGFRPMILVDTSGRVGDRLQFIRAALKHMLYSFLVTKSKFNFVKFTPQGQPAAWARGMVAPLTQVLREAEEWIDALRPLKAAPNYIEALQEVLSPPEVDCVYIISSGLPGGANVEYIVQAMRALNLKDVPINIISVEAKPKAELELRRLSEESHGIFRQKAFTKTGFEGDSRLATLLREGRITAGSSTGETGEDHLSIKGQLRILAVMNEEQERQKNDWLEEQTCANRLLLATSTQPAVPEPHEARKAMQRSALAASGRLVDIADSTATSTPGLRGQSSQRVADLLTSTTKVEASIGKPSIANPWDRPTPSMPHSIFDVSKTGHNSRPTSRSGSGRMRSARRRSSSRNPHPPFR
mmetsp:Transcript_19658/g.45819  ORF Transcript_19658/g.45819 Transcript_19658/m.45819 type:complete len:643 (-) Transcript_19658:117-2045(-)